MCARAAAAVDHVRVRGSFAVAGERPTESGNARGLAVIGGREDRPEDGVDGQVLAHLGQRLRDDLQPADLRRRCRDTRLVVTAIPRCGTAANAGAKSATADDETVAVLRSLLGREMRGLRHSGIGTSGAD